MSAIKHLLFILFFLVDFIDPITPISITIDADSFGPYVAFQEDSTITFKVNCTGSSICSEKFSCGPSQNDIRYSYKTESHVSGSTYKCKVTLPTYMYLSESGMYCRIQVLGSDGRVVKTLSFTIYPITTNQTINPQDYISKQYTINYARYSISRDRFSSTSEKYSFPDYLDFLNIDTYYRLDLSGVHFNCSPIGTYSYESAYLEISDYHSIFPYLFHDNNHFVHIPLKITSNGSKRSFSFANTMYVHPKTLEMSMFLIDGFVPTRYFYLPVNKKKEMQEERVIVSIKHGGYAKSNITWDLSYLANNNVIGRCADSDYCIVGGINND